LEHFETLRAITTGRSARTAPHTSKGHARFDSCYADSSKKKTGFARTQAGPENVKCEPGSMVYFPPS
jgi:hypothetical protein